MKKVVIGIVIFAVIALVLAFVPIIKVQYEDTEPLDYAAQSYLERADNRALRVAILSSVILSQDTSAINEALNLAYGIPEYHPIGHVSVSNEDEIQGTFKVEITFYTGEQQYAEEFMLELKPGQIEEVEKSADVDYDKEEWSWQYNVIPEIKVVTYCERVPVFEYLLS